MVIPTKVMNIAVNGLKTGYIFLVEMFATEPGAYGRMGYHPHVVAKIREKAENWSDEKSGIALTSTTQWHITDSRFCERGRIALHQSTS